MCRAFLSPEYKIGGHTPKEDDPDEEFLIYRCNLGVVTLNLPMIYMKSKVEGKDFYEVLDYYMDIIRGINLKTVAYLKKLKASSSPLVFMEGGFDGGTLSADDSIEPVLKHSTISFGFGGLHELTELHLGKSLSQDESFALDTMKHINDRVDMYKKEDGILHAIYSSPGESALSWMCEKFVKKYGKVKSITDKGFFTNSFHMCVDEDMTPIQKIDLEAPFFPLTKGGCICHVKIPSIDPEVNEGIAEIVRYSMSLGLYQSVNHAQNRCLSCGLHYIGDDSLPDDENYKCPECGSKDVVGIRQIRRPSRVTC